MFASEMPILTYRGSTSTSTSTSSSHALASVVKSSEGITTGLVSTSRKSVIASDGKTRKYHVVRIEETASFLRFNANVSSGYRRHPLTLKDAMYSMVGYLHNETANIYTHLLGAVLFAYLAITEPRNWRNNNLHYSFITIYDVSCAVCLLSSVAYHTLMNSAPTEKEYKQLMLFDMYGIWIINTVCVYPISECFLLTFSSFCANCVLRQFGKSYSYHLTYLQGAGLALSYSLLPCSPLLIHLGLIFVPAFCSLLWIMILSKTPMQRVLAFGICWALRFLTIVSTYFLGLAHWTPSRFLASIGTELLPLVGGIVNVYRFPEAIYPGRFDYFHSHTLMHMLTVLSMVFQHFLSHHRAAHIIDADYVLADCVAKDTTTLAQIYASLFGLARV